MKPPRCISCGNLFSPTRFMQRTCSYPCALQFAKSIKVEAKTRNEGKRPVINSKPVSAVREHPTFVKNREALKDNMRRKEGYLWCERCFQAFGMKSNSLECHHLIYRSEKPEHKFLHDKRNLYICCEPCHTWFHASKGNRDQIVAERKLNLLFGDDVLNKTKP